MHLLNVFILTYFHHIEHDFDDIRKKLMNAIKQIFFISLNEHKIENRVKLDLKRGVIKVSDLASGDFLV